MTKILVVDDDGINLEVIKVLIKKYIKNREIELQVDTAENGVEAVDKVKQSFYDLIFMDVLMPVMNGIEATIAIKKIHQQSMIIAISSLSDEVQQNQILKNGAEDYIVKPFNGPHFSARLDKYLKLIHSRDVVSMKPKAINVFSHEIYSYELRFHIVSEDDLNQVWETLLIRFEMQNKIDNLSDFVRQLDKLGHLWLTKNIHLSITQEEDKRHFYFSLDNVSHLDVTMIEKLINSSKYNYVIKGNILSFALPKTSTYIDMTESELEEAEAEIEETHIYSFIDVDDMDDLEDLLYTLHTKILRMQTEKLVYQDVEEIAENFYQLASILSMSNESFTISEALKNLTDTIKNNGEKFLDNADDIAEFSLSFVKDMIMYKDMMFYEGAPSVDFMDASMMSNSNMLRAILDPQSVEPQDDTDDIFDF